MTSKPLAILATKFGKIYFQNALTLKINKCSIETIMNQVQLHCSFKSQPKFGLIAYWVMITRGDSNRAWGDRRI